MVVKHYVLVWAVHMIEGKHLQFSSLLSLSESTLNQHKQVCLRLLPSKPVLLFDDFWLAYFEQYEISYKTRSYQCSGWAASTPQIMHQQSRKIIL